MSEFDRLEVIEGKNFDAETMELVECLVVIDGAIVVRHRKPSWKNVEYSDCRKCPHNGVQQHIEHLIADGLLIDPNAEDESW